MTTPESPAHPTLPTDDRDHPGHCPARPVDPVGPPRRKVLIQLTGVLSAGVGGAGVFGGLPARAATGRIELQGHRGARALAPESTLGGFARALEIGVDVLELDTVVTADDVVIVHHDRRLHPDHTRRADGLWLDGPGRVLRELQWVELASLDVGRARPGSRTSATFPRQQAMDGERIPSLAQVLDLARRTGPAGLRWNIETKLSPLAPNESPSPEAFVRLLLQVLNEGNALGRTTIQSFDWRTLREVQRQAPGVPTACLTSQQPSGPGVDDGLWTAGLRRADLGSVPRMVKTCGARVWSPFHGDLSRDALREAQALGLTVAVWTVNDPQVMERMIDWGVDALITDEPDRAREVMAARGLSLPSGRGVTRR